MAELIYQEFERGFASTTHIQQYVARHQNVKSNSATTLRPGFRKKL